MPVTILSRYTCFPLILHSSRKVIGHHCGMLVRYDQSSSAVFENTQSGSALANDTLIQPLGSLALLVTFSVAHALIFFQLRVCRLEVLGLVDVGP
jgi:hypothetical protein